MPPKLLTQISLWKHQQNPNQTTPTQTPYQYLQDEESTTSEKDSLQTLTHEDDISRLSTRPRIPTSEKILITILILLIFLLSGLLIDTHRKLPSSPFSSSPSFPSSSPSQKPKSPIPDFPQKQVLFDYSPTYESGPQSHALWDAIIPAGGLIAIKHPEQYGLKKGLDTTIPDAQVFGVSVTHQFHCLKMLRTNYQTYIYGNRTQHLDPKDPMPRSVNHMFHCMDYLRQTILCNADLTVEWEALTEGEEKLPTGHIDGYGVMHQCRDWDQVRSWMQSQLPPDEKFLRPQ